MRYIYSKRLYIKLHTHFIDLVWCSNSNCNFSFSFYFRFQIHLRRCRRRHHSNTARVSPHSTRFIWFHAHSKKCVIEFRCVIQQLTHNSMLNWYQWYTFTNLLDVSTVALITKNKTNISFEIDDWFFPFSFQFDCQKLRQSTLSSICAHVFNRNHHHWKW